MIIDGKAIAEKLKQKILEEVEISKIGLIFLKLVVILVGNDLANSIYPKEKKKLQKKLAYNQK